jgi:CSLREA domain-containing protein
MDVYARRRGIGSKSLLAALLIVATTPVLAPVPAQAADDVVTETPTLTVNTTADTPDANPGNNVCADASGACSLRAAIEESNAKPGPATVSVPGGTYYLTGQLVIEDDLTLNGAGKGTTFIDGNNVTEVLHVRTTELLVCDAGTDSVASYDRHGQLNPDFLSSGKGGMDSPNSIIIPSIFLDSDVYVTASNSGIHRFSSAGEHKGLYVNQAEAGYVVDAVFGTGGNLYLADYLGSRIPNGTGGLSYPSGLAFFDNDLYVTSTNSNQVLRYNADGSFVGAFANGLNTPRDLLFHQGKLYIANEGSDEVRRYNAATGAYEGAFVTAGSGGLDGPTELAFGPDGDLYVISSNNKRILRYNGSTGAFRDVFIQGGTPQLDNPTCLEWRDGAGAGPTVKINDVTIRNGETILGGGPSGGITIDIGASVELHNSIVRDNDTRLIGGGIRNYGTLLLNKVEVHDNTVNTAITGGATSTGGGIFNDGVLRIRRSSIYDNIAVRGGGIANEGTLEVVNSTISGNRAIGGGGGGIRNLGGVAKINASTITNNRANEPGEDDGDRFGGGIYNLKGGRITMANTILAENFDNRSPDQADYSPDCYSSEARRFTSHRDNLVGILTDNCKLSDVSRLRLPHDQVGTPAVPLDPRVDWLEPSTFYTPVHKLISTSSALNGDQHQSSDPFFNCPSTDQRGTKRPQGLRCDIGAFELPQGAGDGVPELPEGVPPTGSATATAITGPTKPTGPTPPPSPTKSTGPTSTATAITGPTKPSAPTTTATTTTGPTNPAGVPSEGQSVHLPLVSR